MVFPAQTSLIPAQIALGRYLEQGGNLLGNYPYWYLGTTPYRYLTGPILPIVLVSLSRILPGLSLFEIFLGLIGVVFSLGAIGLYLLAKELGANRFSASLAAFFYFFGFLVPLLFRFSSGVYLVAFSFLPFILALYLKLLKSPKLLRKKAVSFTILIAFVFLIDALVIPTLVLGMATIFLAQADWKKTEKKLKKSLLLIAYGLLLATLWHTPGYWLTLLGAPSLAGKGLIGVINLLLRLFPTILALGMAIASVKFFKKKNLLRDFCFYWLFTFGFLTLLRFLSDPDFWLDWISYGTELQFGGAIAITLILTKLLSKLKLSAVRYPLSAIVFSFYLLSFVFVFNKYVLGTLQYDITGTVEYRIGSQISKTAKPGERVFLSGTSVFWLNAFFDIPQVRGGVDQSSTDPRWREATWEIREGLSAEDAKKWLKTLKIKYLVVHTQESEEFYHDFTYPEKFEGAEGLKMIYDEAGDKIYVVED